MTAEQKAFIVRAITNARGDDYERADAAFRGMTPMQMNEQHGSSGRTRGELLDGHQRHAELAEQSMRGGAEPDRVGRADPEGSAGVAEGPDGGEGNETRIT